MCSSLVFAVYCAGSGLCDELITGSEESYSSCFSTSVRPRAGKFSFHKTTARSQQITRKYLSNFF